MPELPEVETVVRDLRAHGLPGAVIRLTIVRWARTVAAHAPDAFCHALAGRTVMAVTRRAKFIVLTLDTGNRLLILNPSEYHNELTALAGGMGIVSCGLLDTADPERVRGEIVKMVGDPVCESLRVQMVQNKIRTALIDFPYLVDKAIDELKK